MGKEKNKNRLYEKAPRAEMIFVKSGANFPGTLKG
jgi:hypothetical protein